MIQKESVDSKEERQRSWKAVFSWALYDWANSAFSCTVMAGFFPAFFKDYWSAGVPDTESTLYLGTANSLESIIVAVCAPVLGAIADRGRSKKKFLFVFASLGILATAGMYFVGQGNWKAAAFLYVLAAGGFAASLIFYDALLVAVAGDERSDAVSALGYSLGYLGGGLLFALNVAMFLWPGAFGLADGSAAVRASFLSVAVWWSVFSVPLFRYVREAETRDAVGILAAVPQGFCQLASTCREIRKLKVVFWFLLGYWLYIDGVDTVMRMALDYGKALRLETKDLVLALLITQFVGFPSALAFGKVGGRVGTKAAILFGLGVYLGVTVWGFFLRNAWEFYTLASIIGIVQGGVQALSRSMYSRLIPKTRAAEFFGFYNILGKFGAAMGPVLMGFAAYLSGNPRFGILSIAVLFAAGGAVLFFVDEAEGRRRAAEMEGS